MVDKTRSFICPKCEIEKNKKVKVYLKPGGGYLCPSCGSTYKSRESANEVRKELEKNNKF